MLHAVLVYFARPRGESIQFFSVSAEFHSYFSMLRDRLNTTTFFIQKTHLARNKSLRTPLYSYIRRYSACRRFGSCLCYTLVSLACDTDKFHRTARPATAAAFESVSRSFRIDVSKNSNQSSFRLDSLRRYKEVETSVASVASRKSNLSQRLKAGKRLLKQRFSYRVFKIFLFTWYLRLPKPYQILLRVILILKSRELFS